MVPGAPAVIAVYGPTGSGKTDVAVRVARALGTEVVNCDPAQCYRGLPILTNQPDPDEHDAIAPHRMIGVWSLRHEASFVGFAERAHAEIDDAIASHGVVVACGGSGLYLQAALTRLAHSDLGGAPQHDPATRAELEEAYDQLGGGALLAELTALDPHVGARLHPNDRPRIVRALEVARRGESIAPKGASHWDAAPRVPRALFGLTVDRAVVRTRIDRRTRSMFDAGVLEEVAGLAGARGERASDVFSTTARKLHGLSDCLGALDGSWSRAQALEQMTVRTRQYAKRQDTWARRWPGLEPVDATDGDVDRIARAVIDSVRTPTR